MPSSADHSRHLLCKTHRLLDAFSTSGAQLAVGLWDLEESWVQVLDCNKSLHKELQTLCSTLKVLRNFPLVLCSLHSLLQSYTDPWESGCSCRGNLTQLLQTKTGNMFIPIACYRCKWVSKKDSLHTGMEQSSDGRSPKDSIALASTQQKQQSIFRCYLGYFSKGQQNHPVSKRVLCFKM